MPNKCEKTNDLSLYKQIVDMLSIVFLHNDTIQLIKKDDFFSKGVVDLINLCYSYEESDKNLEPKTPDFITAYKSIKNKTLKPKIVSIDDNSEVIDRINYLKIILVNNHKIIWDELVNSLSEKKYKEPVNKKTTKKHDETTITDEQIIEEKPPKEENNSGRTYQNSEDFLRQNNISLDNIADNIIKQQATMMLNKDIIENRFYQFDSKPKAFKLSKFILYSLWILFFGFMFAIMGLTISLSQSDSWFALTSQQNIESKDFIEQLKIGVDVFSIPRTNMLFNIILTVFATLIISFFIYREARNFKNDNIQYAFNSMYSWLILMFALFQVLFPLMLNPNGHIFSCFNQIEHLKDMQTFSIQLPWSSQDNTLIRLEFNNSGMYNYLNAYYIINILLLVITGVVVIWTIALMIIKPKLDIQRINQKIQEYYEDIKSGKIQFDGKDIGNIGGFFGKGRSLF